MNEYEYVSFEEEVLEHEREMLKSFLRENKLKEYIIDAVFSKIYDLIEIYKDLLSTFTAHREIESIEKEMEKIRQKLHEIDNEEKKLIVENKDLISPIIDFFKNTKEGERILYTEDPYDGFFGGEGLSESTAVILYAEYKILKTKKVRW